MLHLEFTKDIVNELNLSFEWFFDSVNHSKPTDRYKQPTDYFYIQFHMVSKIFYIIIQ